MSNMADLSTKLDEYKLSDAQKNAVLELMEAPFKTAKPNTIASLVKKGVIEKNVQVDGLYSFTDEFARFMGWDHLVAPDQTEEEIRLDEEYFESESFADIIGQDPQELHEQVEETLEDLLRGDPWGVKDSDGEIKPLDPEVDEILFRKLVRKYDLMGQWRNSEVWGELTLEEIKKDIKTARPVNREARRKHKRILTNAFRQEFCIRPRKQVKICGAVGL